MQKHKNIPTRLEFINKINEAEASFNDSLVGWAVTGMFKAMWKGGKFLAGKIGDAMRKQTLNTLGRAWASEYEKAMTNAQKSGEASAQKPGDVVDDTAKPEANPETDAEPQDTTPTGAQDASTDTVADNTNSDFNKTDRWLDTVHELIKTIKAVRFNRYGKVKFEEDVAKVNDARRTSLEVYDDAVKDNQDIQDNIYVKSIHNIIKDDIAGDKVAFDNLVNTMGDSLNKIVEAEDDDDEDNTGDTTGVTDGGEGEDAENTNSSKEAEQALADAQAAIKAEAPKAKSEKAKEFIRNIWTKAKSLAKKGDVKELKKMAGILRQKLDAWMMSDTIPDFATESMRQIVESVSDDERLNAVIRLRMKRKTIENAYADMTFEDAVFFFKALNNPLDTINEKESAELDLATFPNSTGFRNSVLKNINYDALLRIQLEAEANYTRFSGPKSEDIASMKQYWERVIADVNAKYNKYIDSAYIKKAVNELRVKDEKLGRGVTKASSTVSGNTYFMADSFGATETVDSLKSVAPNQNLILQLDMPPNTGTYFMVSRSMDKNAQKIGGESYYWFVTFAVRRKDPKDNTLEQTKLNSNAVGQVFSKQNGHMFIAVSSRNNSTALKHAWFYDSDGKMLCDNPVNFEDLNGDDIKTNASKKTGIANKMSVVAAAKAKDGTPVGSSNYFKMAILQKSLVEGDVLGNKIGVNPDTIHIDVNGFDSAEENHKQLMEAIQ